MFAMGDCKVLDFICEFFVRMHGLNHKSDVPSGLLLVCFGEISHFILIVLPDYFSNNDFSHYGLSIGCASSWDIFCDDRIRQADVLLGFVEASHILLISHICVCVYKLCFGNCYFVDKDQNLI